MVKYHKGSLFGKKVVHFVGLGYPKRMAEVKAHESINRALINSKSKKVKTRNVVKTWQKRMVN